MKFEIHAEEFEKKLKELGDTGCDEIASAALNDMAARTLRLVRKATPVGKKSNYAKPEVRKMTGKYGKKKKFMTVYGIQQYEFLKGYHGGTLRRGWSANPAVKRGSQWRTAIYNPVEYAGYVEYGHRQTPGRYVPAIGKRLKRSWVPGKNMLSDSTQAVRSEAGNIVRKAIRRAIKERFG